MKSIFILNFIIFSNISFASSVIKFQASTNGPGISVEGEAKNINIALDFNKLENTSLVIDVMDLSTGMEKRDKHLHEKVFNTQVAGTSKIEYKISKINCPKTEGEVECTSTGNLKIKDVSNEVQFPIKVNFKDQTIEGKTTVSLNQFKLNAPSFMGISVLDGVNIDFKVSSKN